MKQMSAVISLVILKERLTRLTATRGRLDQSLRTEPGLETLTVNVDLCISHCQLLHQQKGDCGSRRRAGAPAGWAEVKGEEDLLASALLRLLSSCYLNSFSVWQQGRVTLPPRNLVYLTLLTFPSQAAVLSLQDHFSYEVIAM